MPAVVRPRRLVVVDRELDCGEDQREQDRDDRCRDGVDVHLRVSPLGAPSKNRDRFHDVKIPTQSIDLDQSLPLLASRRSLAVYHGLAKVRLSHL